MISISLFLLNSHSEAFVFVSIMFRNGNSKVADNVLFTEQPGRGAS